MPRLAKPLSALQIEKAKPRDKPYTLADGNGLYLQVAVSGQKAWMVRYKLPERSAHTEALIGYYPAMSLAESRSKAIQARRDAKQGVASVGVRKAQREALAAADAEQVAEVQAQAQKQWASFRAVSSRWLADKRPSWATEPIARLA
jgi:hypothetical protein